jgi:hypothetical protein
MLLVNIFFDNLENPDTLDHGVQLSPMHDAVPHWPKLDRLARATPDFPTHLIGPRLLSSIAAAPWSSIIKSLLWGWG